jgi:DNA repair protein RecN (Recombination protein N)
MLALKTVLANADATPTLIFDEIDQGIGGRVGGTVGQKLWDLTGGQALAVVGDLQHEASAIAHQVLCITHLPQLAAFGDRHFTVNKRIYAENGVERTGTVVRDLDEGERIEELAQMLGASGKAGRSSVLEMMDAVEQHKAAGLRTSAG